MLAMPKLMSSPSVADTIDGYEDKVPVSELNMGIDRTQQLRTVNPGFDFG